MAGDVVSNLSLAFMRGSKLFCDGQPCPARPDDDDDPDTRNAWLWYGYRCAKFVDFRKRCLVAETLNMPEPEWKE